MKITNSKRVAMVVFSYYPADPRPRREAEALIEKGYTVDMICLRNEHESRKEIFHDVCIHRVPLQKKRGSKSRYLLEYFLFFSFSLIKLTTLFLERRYQTIHIHNMPDVLVFTSLIPKIAGAQIVLDLHDPMPEVFMAKYGFDRRHPIIRLLKFLEKVSIAFSDLVITPNIAFRDRFISRSCRPAKIQIIMNSPQNRIFSTASEANQSTHDDHNARQGPILMFHGTIVERHGLDIALQALNLLRTEFPTLRFKVFGDGDYVPRFVELTQALDLNDVVQYYGRVPIERIAQEIKEIDIGLIPNRRSAFTDINMPTRIFEYLAMEKPVIVPRTPGIQDYFSDESIYFFKPNDIQDLAQKIRSCLLDADKRQATLNNGIAIYAKHEWSRQKSRLLGLYAELTGV